MLLLCGRSVSADASQQNVRSSLEMGGKYRTNELNIGCDPAEIVQRIPQLVANAEHWLERKTFPIDECLIRFHYQLVKIHPFANGNGRHARMITDVIAAKYGQKELTWGAGQNLVAEGSARAAYLAALRALDTDENDINPLLRFARS